MKHKAFNSPAVKAVFDNYPKKIRAKLMLLRELIFQIAEQSADVGQIEETLKWESPSYLTHMPRSGTTIRLSGVKSALDDLAISVHCQTSLVSDFKQLYPQLKYDGNRSIILNVNTKLPLTAVKHFIYLALSYHARKKHGLALNGIV